jgi:Kdo2-lipid IVA lauroyltransferase/acyltransferase
MKSTLVTWLFDLAARLPLAALHRAGATLGWMTYLLSGKYADRLRENLEHAHPGMAETSFRKLLRSNACEMGKSLTELPWVWRRPLDEVVRSVHSVHGLEHLEAAQRHGRGIIFLTPHLGCFEIVSLYLAARMPMTIMYRTPKLAWLDGVMRHGRERGQTKLARADISGVRTLFKALKRQEAIGLLPDQVPGNGEGEWAPFFGRPAYTMTLVARLAESSGATILMSFGERLPQGAGYIIHFHPLEFIPGSSATLQLNTELEQLIRTCPAQYLWSYNRYKTPAGATPAGQIEAGK